VQNRALGSEREVPLREVCSIAEKFLHNTMTTLRLWDKLLVRGTPYNSLFVVVLNKSRALDILHELYANINEVRSENPLPAHNIQVSHICTGGYQVNLKLKLDDHSRAVINEFVKKRKLYLKEERSQITLRSIGD
jgi:hypothetical protein